MKISIDMPLVSRCNIANCSYNRDNVCHAKAITVGDGRSPLCDTVFYGTEIIHAVNLQAGVGACKVSACRFNNDLECGASDVSIGAQGNNAVCMTFAQR